MKKVYFAGKFLIERVKNKPLAERLKNDYRAKILGGGEMLSNASNDLMLKNGLIYLGPFYCEQASNGNFTSTDCQVVLESEYNAVLSCDIYFALFDQSFSVGTIVELGWAIENKKQIVICYKEEESNYEIKSDYWFAIADAIKRAKNLKIIKYNKVEEVIKMINEGDVFNNL